MKKAFLVEVTAMTRVVVDVLEDFEHYDSNNEKNEKICEYIVQVSIEKMRQNPNDYICFDNVVNFHEDVEVPYDSECDEVL